MRLSTSERFLSTLTRKIHDRCDPELNMVTNHTDDVATTNVWRVWRSELKQCWATDSGQLVYDKLIDPRDDLQQISNPTPTGPYVQYPGLLVRKPFIMKGRLSDAARDQMSQLYSMNPGGLLSFRIRPEYWRILRGVRIGGKSRRTVLGDAHRKISNRLGSTSAFIKGENAVGKIMAFLAVYIEDTTTPDLYVEKQFAHIQTYPLHFDEKAQMSFVLRSEMTEEYVYASDIGLASVIFAPDMQQIQYNRLFIIRAETGLDPHNSSRFGDSSS